MPDLVEVVDAARLVDHHCHGVLTTDVDRPGFEALISEGGAPADGLSNFDTPVGMAVRRHCAPVLGLPPRAAPDDYLARRRELGAGEVNRRFLAAAGTGRFLVDTGFRPDGLTTPAELAALGGGEGHEIARLEFVAEAVAADGVDADGLLPAVIARLERALTGPAVGVKTVAAYRTGLDLNPVPPAVAEVTNAADAWLKRGGRLQDPVLTRALLWAAVELGRPIQFHIGFGDADIRMHRVDPTLLTDWLHRHRAPVMLLHCWPYHRQAAYLAAVHPHVHLDLGLALGHVGPRAGAVLQEAAELAPFGKLLHSSDAFGVPELYLLGARAFRQALAELLTARVGAGEWAAADAERIAGMIAHRNATRVYGLPG